MKKRAKYTHTHTHTVAGGECRRSSSGEAHGYSVGTESHDFDKMASPEVVLIKHKKGIDNTLHLLSSATIHGTHQRILMENINADGFDGVQMKVLTHRVAIERSDHALLRRNGVLLRLLGFPPHETQRVVDTVHRSHLARKVELPVTKIGLGNATDVAGFPRAAAGSLAVAQGALNGRVRVDGDDARAEEHLMRNKKNSARYLAGGAGEAGTKTVANCLCIPWVEPVP